MIGFLFATPPERRLLPGGRLSAPTPWLIAIMMFVMVTVGATGLALAGASRAASQGVAHRYMIQIADGRAAAPRAIAAARQVPGVVAVTEVSEAELRETLEHWLGPIARDRAIDLPLPALIDVDLAPGADPARVEAAVRGAVPSAGFSSHRARLGPLLGALAALAWVAAAIVLLIALATAAAVVLATRSALAAQGATIEIMHGIGATDDQVTRLFQRRIAIDALIGGVAGATLAGLVLASVVSAGFGGAGVWTGGPLLAPLDWALLALLPLAGAVLATAVARATVLRALRDRL